MYEHFARIGKAISAPKRLELLDLPCQGPRTVEALRGLAEARLAEVAQVACGFVEDHGAMEAVAAEELLRRVRAGEVTVLDVRPPDEYRAGHIPGAISIPVADLKARLKELPKDREVVA